MICEKKIAYAKSLAKMAKVLYENSASIDNDKIITHAIAEALFQAGPIYSGLMSKECKDLPAAKMTNEHFFPRKRSADLIMDQIKKGKSVKRITNIALSRTRVHRVTPAQNQYLRKFQNAGYSNWQQEYAAANIELIPYERKNAYTYIVEGQQYNSLQEIAKKYNMTPDGARYRVLSKSNKFTDWNRKKL